MNRITINDSDDIPDIVIDTPRRSLLLPPTNLSHTFTASTVSLASNSASSHSSRDSASTADREQYKYARWYEVQDIDVKGSTLHSPRVRAPPPMRSRPASGNASIAATAPTSRGKTLHTRHFKDIEDWENKEEGNFSYQGLGDSYQLAQFMALLHRLFRCQRLFLMHNSLTSLKGVSFKVCTTLDLTGNHFSSFKDLAHIPVIEELNLADNGIASVDGLSRLRSLRHLRLDGNPIAFTENYRQRVFHALPTLVSLDGLDRQDDDLDTSMSSRSCVIS